MKNILLAFFLLCSFPILAQDELLDMLGDSNKPEPIKATFKATRVINGHSIENVAANHLDFRIHHRFGRINQGIYDLFGLDFAQIRLSLEYGITDNLMVGLGRSSNQKLIDGFVKFRLLRQKTNGGSPISISYFGNTGIVTLDRQFPNVEYTFPLENRLSYTNQLIIARKFNEHISLQLSPTHIHFNLVPDPTYANDQLATGIAGRVKLSKRISLNAEYFYRLPTGKTRNHNFDSFSAGLDIETGGHVFQLMASNSLGMVEQAFISQTDGSWGRGDIYFGFNISRTFSLKGNSSKW